MSDRRRDAATLATGTGLVAGGAQLRSHAVERAHELSGVKRRGRPGPRPEGPFVPSLQVKRIPKVPGRGSARAAWLIGSGLATVGAPAVASGAHNLYTQRRHFRKADDYRPFIQQGIAGTTDVWRKKAKDSRHVSPWVRGLQLGIGAGTGAAGAQAAHKIIDHVHPNTRYRPALTAMAGIGGGLASLPSNRAITRRVTRGQYEVTATGVKRRKTPPVRPSRRANVVETRASRGARPNARQQIVPTDRHGMSKGFFNGPRGWAMAAGGTGLAAGGGAVASQRGSRKQRQHGKELRNTAIGAAAGQAAYQAPAYAASQYTDRRTPLHMRRDVPQSTLPKELKPLKRQYEKERREWKGAVRDRGMTNAQGYRIYPKTWPHAKLERTLGWTHGGRTGQAIGAAATVTGAAAGLQAARRRRVRKYYGEGMSRGEKRTRVMAAGAVPGPAGPINAARMAARLAPPDQRRSAAALQYGGSTGGGWTGAAAGAYGAAALASRSPRFRARSEALNSKINEAKSSAYHRGARAVPGKTGRVAAQRVAEASYRVGPGRSARALSNVASRPGRVGSVGRTVMRGGRPLAAAPAAAAVGALAGKATGTFAGGYLGYGEALHREQKHDRQIRKDARVASNMSRGDELRQLKRKRHNAALTRLGATTGAVGTATYAGSLALATRKPAIARTLSQASLGTAIAGGGVGSVGGFRSAKLQREEVDRRRRELGVVKHDDRSRVHLSAGHAGRPACGTGPRPATKIVQTSRLPGNVTCNACRRTKAWNEQVNKRLPSVRPAVTATRRSRTGALMPVRRRMTVVKIDTTMDRNTANRYVGRYGTRGPLPRNIDRSEKMKAYEGRYVALGGPKGEKWKRRAQRADKVTGAGVALGAAGAATQLAAQHPKAAALASRHGRDIKRIGRIGERTALGSAIGAAGSELYHRHAEHRQSSYSHSAAGVAASALRRMRDYTPD